MISFHGGNCSTSWFCLCFQERKYQDQDVRPQLRTTTAQDHQADQVEWGSGMTSHQAAGEHNSTPLNKEGIFVEGFFINPVSLKLDSWYLEKSGDIVPGWEKHYRTLAYLHHVFSLLFISYNGNTFRKLEVLNIQRTLEENILHPVMLHG